MLNRILVCAAVVAMLTAVECGAASTQSDIATLRARAEQGDAKAQYDLGYCYDTGDGVKKNKAEAAKWCRKAAEQGNTEARFMLGLYYYEGKGVTQNKVEAIKWYRRAAEQGNTNAQNILDAYGAVSHGVPQNKAEVAKWEPVAATSQNNKTLGMPLTSFGVKSSGCAPEQEKLRIMRGLPDSKNI